MWKDATMAYLKGLWKTTKNVEDVAYLEGLWTPTKYLWLLTGTMKNHTKMSKYSMP
jgi:hypothetical protein